MNVRGTAALGAMASLLGCSEPERVPPPVGSNANAIGMALPTGGIMASETTAAGTGTSADTDGDTDTGLTTGTGGPSGDTTVATTNASDSGMPPLPTVGDQTGSSVPTTGKELPEPTGG